MTKTPQDLFEIHYADQNDKPVEQIAVHRWKNQGGYDLPAMDRAYRYFIAGYKASSAAYAEITDGLIGAQEKLRLVTLDEFRLLYPPAKITAKQEGE